MSIYWERKQFFIRTMSALFEGELKKKLGIVHFTELISELVTGHCSTDCRITLWHTLLFITSAPSATVVFQDTIVERLLWKMGLLCLPLKIVLQCQPNSSTQTLIRLDWRLTKLLTTRWLLWWLFPLHWTHQCPFLRVDKPFVLMDFLPRHFFHKLFYLSSFSKFI